jgi:hypothetical protein
MENRSVEIDVSGGIIHILDRHRGFDENDSVIQTNIAVHRGFQTALDFHNTFSGGDGSRGRNGVCGIT